MSSLELEPPGQAVATAEAPGPFAISDASSARIKAVAREFAGGFLAVDPHSPEFDRMIRQIGMIGRDEVLKLSGQAHKVTARSGVREQAVSMVNTWLAKLREVIDRLNPGAGDALLKPRGFFGLFARTPALESYFERYTRSEAEIQAALAALAQSRDTLLHDNIAVATCRSDAWPLLHALAEAVAMCEALDERFDRLAAQLDTRDPAKANRLRTGALFEVRQRHGDLLTQMAVSQQGYAMLGLIESNNLELVKGIDRATATTIAALQTAIVAAQTLSNQRIVLDRIQGVQKAASAMSDRASAATAQANTRVALDSAEAAQQVAALRNAFADVVASVDSLERQQHSALSAL